MSMMNRGRSNEEELRDRVLELENQRKEDQKRIEELDKKIERMARVLGITYSTKGL